MNEPNPPVRDLNANVDRKEKERMAFLEELFAGATSSADKEPAMSEYRWFIYNSVVGRIIGVTEARRYLEAFGAASAMVDLVRTMKYSPGTSEQPGIDLDPGTVDELMGRASEFDALIGRPVG